MQAQLDPVAQIGECAIGTLVECPSCGLQYDMQKGYAWFIGVYDGQYKYLYAHSLRCLLHQIPLEAQQ